MVEAPAVWAAGVVVAEVLVAVMEVTADTEYQEEVGLEAAGRVVVAKETVELEKAQSGRVDTGVWWEGEGEPRERHQAAAEVLPVVAASDQVPEEVVCPAVEVRVVAAPELEAPAVEVMETEAMVEV